MLFFQLETFSSLELFTHVVRAMLEFIGVKLEMNWELPEAEMQRFKWQVRKEKQKFKN